MSTGRPDRVTLALALAALVTTALALHRADGNGDLVRLGTWLDDAGPGGATDGRRVPRDRSSPRGAAPTTDASPAFTDVTGPSGVDFVHARLPTGACWFPELIGAGGALLDVEDDGDLDLFLVQGGPLVAGGVAGAGADVEAEADEPRDADVGAATDPADPRDALFLNDGAGRFALARDHGTALGGHGMGAAAADVDADGDTDLFVTRLGRDALLVNDGTGRFTDRTDDAGLARPGYATSAAFADVDLDGDLDLYVARYVDWSPARERPCYSRAGVRDYCHPATYPAQADQLLLNDGGGRFTDVSASSGIGADARPGLAVLADDLDRDGQVDLYVANDQEPAFWWRPRGDGTWEDAAMLAGCAFDGDGFAIAGMGLAAGDLDDDGDDDLLVTNILGHGHLGLRRGADGWRDDSARLGLDAWSVPDTGWGLALFDQDHDGALDLYVANGHVNRLHETARDDDPFAQGDRFARLVDGTFVEHAAALPDTAATSRAVLSGDLDDDGDLDLVVTANGGPARVLRNDVAGGHAWTRIDVRDAHGSAALGARVEVTAGGRTWRRTVRAQDGYLGSRDPRVHLGLGAAERIERLMVRWPDGTEDGASDLPVRARLRVEREPFGVSVVERAGLVRQAGRADATEATGDVGEAAPAGEGDGR